MSNAGDSNPTDNDSTFSSRVEYANDLYSKVVLMCEDWTLVDESKAQVIIEYAQDALKAFGDTNQEKKVKLKEVLQRAENILSPDSIDSLKKRSERVVLKGIYPKNRKVRNTLLIVIGVLWILGLGIPLYLYLRSSPEPSPAITSNTSNIPSNQKNIDTALPKDASSDDEAQVIVDKATVTLDLTSSWVELDRPQRENERLSKGILRGVFSGVRKINKAATFTHRVGTSSNFRPEWKAISPHPITDRDEIERKCDPKTKFAYLLFFDISNEKVNAPFDLKYEINFWNAHNGETGDWQSFFVSRATKQLVMKITFPKNKPYTELHFMHAYGIDCKSADFKDFPQPKYNEYTDKKTGAKVITWTIEAPQVLWIYMIGWDW